MTPSRKLYVKHRRLNYRINLLSELIDIIKDNKKYFYKYNNELEIIYEKSFWLMLNHNMLIDKYMMSSSKKAFLKSGIEDYESIIQSLEECIEISIEVIIENTKKNIDKVTKKYEDELTDHRFIDRQTEIEEKLTIIMEEYKSESLKQQLVIMEWMSETFNYYIENQKLLEKLQKKKKRDNSKQLYIYPAISAVLGTVMGYLLK